MLLLGMGLLFLPETKKSEETSPENLLWAIIQPTRFVSVDEVAKMIIEQDPTLLLADVRTAIEYKAFALPGALNIPIDSLTISSYSDYLDIEDKNVVFYSNNGIIADQAWVIAKRLGFDNIYVLEGGLNDWFTKIMNPKSPGSTASNKKMELYQFRCGARNFFTGNQITNSTGSRKEITVKKRKKTAVEVGGC